MCRRDANDVLVRNFLDHYQVNLLSMPGRRVRCGSVYIGESGRYTAPGLLSDIVEPPITLPEPYREERLADLSGTWSGSISVDVGIGLLENFLIALGAAGLIHELKASAQRTNARAIAFRFAQVSRESLTPTTLGNALTGHRLVRSNPWVRAGNRYYAVAAVLSSRSISVQGSDQRGTGIDLGAGIATMADVHAGVEVKRASENELVYSGRDPLAIGVELYELRWDDQRNELTFHTPKGPIPVHGLADREPPDPAFLGEDNLLVSVEEAEPAP
ncbi:MAG: hypothetical protein ABSB76_07035 [Streptosporangiaceae bacterium]|jgi:hypothetical protein